ncbi:hypothetical protein SERLA73DRAFT_176193 [Serpula lacrymans var. lacrymans S7.3]|uniref:Uncharacterized protein n=2 Tax=Serpula lacrymans var. lacrymans TaxID=341189 RepID=F8PMH5_SERL3|nr:uncharacterized protein SERLADRAFT_458977 [Serpula lacrymans var. lacrymans S7.9]EGO02807.1 hypothetical protein SERLA73DRAFT_176193 [Serpula lacrymans var. lacrymans S7.3]EGO28509.1 hypothetical protein SERLADRAFT_458977 [Serpula lacrymans var. lacrymans S7.9]
MIIVSNRFAPLIKFHSQFYRITLRPHQQLIFSVTAMPAMSSIRSNVRCSLSHRIRIETARRLPLICNLYLSRKTALSVDETSIASNRG